MGSSYCMESVKDTCTLHLFPHQIGPQESLNFLTDSMTLKLQDSIANISIYGKVTKPYI